MTVAQGSRQKLLYCEEPSFGISSTTMIELPSVDGITLNLSKENFRSQVIRSDRQTGQIRHGTKQVSGDIPISFIYGAFDELLEGALFGDWATTSTSATGTDVAASDAENALVKAAGWSGFVAGDWVDVTGTSGGTNDGTAEVATVTGTTMVLAHIDLVDESAGESVTVDKRDKLVNGTSEHYYSFEREFDDLDDYLQFTGCLVNNFTLSVPSSGIVSGAFGVVGKNMVTSTTALDASPTSPSTNDPFAGIDCTGVYEGGVAASYITSFELRLENSAEAKFVLGSGVADHMSFGRCVVSGSATMYFTDLTLLEKFENETETSMQITLTDPDGNVFTIDVPSVVYSTGEVQSAGESSFTVKMDWQAQRDTTTGYTIIMSRGATG